jgi:hypothetical protein
LAVKDFDETQMNSNAKLVVALVWSLWIGSIALGLTVFVGAGAFFQDTLHDDFQTAAIFNARARGPLSALVVPQLVRQPSRSSSSRDVARYWIGFSDDRSLDVATVVEQVRSGYVRYAVRLQLSSGAEQSIAVMGPPGGLRPEVQDMTGDGVRNDLVLTPALIHWPLTVLVNDGHDHFVVAISSPAPGALGSGDDRASGTHYSQSNVALMASRFKADYLTNSAGPLLPQLVETFASPVAQTPTVRLGHSFSPGRAPPRV